MLILTGRLVTPGGVLTGELHVGAIVERIVPRDCDGPYILPGFIDAHVHGGGGGDTMDGAAGVRTLAAFHLRHGTTTLLPTTITNPWERVLAALEGVKAVMSEADPTLPDIPGVHLEGPFISPQRLGAQPPFAMPPTPERIDELLALEVVRVLTLAPELPGALEAARRLAERGVRVSIGHTLAGYEEARALLQVVTDAGGTAGFTHLYNAMGQLSSRAPAAVGAALAAKDTYAELIFDLHHVHPGAMLAALAAKPDHLFFVTDAIRATGLGEGDSELGGQPVRVRGGAARLADGTLAGSVLTLDQALRNAVACGVPLLQASAMVSRIPARYLGLVDRGALEVGLRADLVVLDDRLQVREVYLAGCKVVG